MMLGRVAADDGSGLFAVRRLLVRLGAPRCGAALDCDSPTSPLDLRAPLGGSLLRLPRTRSCLGLGGLVDDDDAEPAATGAISNRLLGLGPVSAREVEQPEDYTCIIAHGSNPKTITARISLGTASRSLAALLSDRRYSR